MLGYHALVLIIPGYSILVLGDIAVFTHISSTIDDIIEVLLANLSAIYRNGTLTQAIVH